MAIGSSPRHRGHPCAQHGFTLIEVLAVIGLIALAVTATAMALHGNARQNLDATARQIAASLRDTRTRAMATQKPQWFILNLRAHTFAAPGADPHAWPDAASIEVTSAAEDASHPGVARFRFFPDGSATGGRIVLGDPHHHVRITVDWLTGAVAVDEDGTGSDGSVRR